VGIVGPNGVGKSTFLNIIMGHLKPLGGKRDVGLTTKFGYYTQEEAVFDDSRKVIEIIQEVAEVIKLANGSVITASQLLNQFLFPPKVQHQWVGKLSGGEKRRLQLLRVLMNNPNFLIFDEPTNDLDIMTLNVLEEYLDNFSGCLLIVSHDRYFMDRLVDHLFVMEGNGNVRDFPGNYTDFRQKFGTPSTLPTETKENKPKEQNKETASQVKTPNQKLSYKEKRELEHLDVEIPSLEKEKNELNNQINKETDYKKLEELGMQLQDLVKKIEEKEMRWLELSERS
jgi:ATP-binding cassette subfamily F protein uup